jgi:hypothetical protein
MNESAAFKALLIVGGLIGLAPSMAMGDTQGGMKIADQVIQGKTKRDAALQIRGLGARDRDAAAIIICAANRSQATAPRQNYFYDPQDYRPAQLGGGSPDLNYDAAITNPYNPQYNPSLLGGAWHDY